MINTKAVSTLNALCLDDEVLVVMDAQSMLQDLGFQRVFEAMNLGDARAVAADHRIDIALLDVNLGDGSTSIAFAEDLIASGTKVIFTTGYNQSEGLVDHLECGFVAKPFSDSVIAAAVSKALGAGETGGEQVAEVPATAG
ncbi:MAG: response regulator [Pseudomonadota bacterium]